MDSPKKEIAERDELLERARGLLGEKRLSEAGELVKRALAIDENHPQSCLLMADILAEGGGIEESSLWRCKAADLRKRAWQRKVEAEARGHHELLGEAGRHEIP